MTTNGWVAGGFNSITPLCNGVATNNTIGARSWTALAYQFFQCPAGSVISALSGIFATFSATSVVYSMQLQCSAVTATAPPPSPPSTPSQCTSYTNNTDSWRDISLSPAFVGANCDAVAPGGGGWVRFVFTDTAGNVRGFLPEVPPTGGVSACGTNFPGWLNGNHPSVRDGIVSRTVCFSTSSTSNCGASGTAFVTNCGGFFVYQLPTPPSCAVANAAYGYCTTSAPPANPGSLTPFCPSRCAPFECIHLG